MLYTEDAFLTCEDISSRFSLSGDSVDESLLSMSDKGIPLDRQKLDGKLYYKLDHEFRVRQAKEHLIKIDESISRSFQNTLLNKFFTQ